MLSQVERKKRDVIIKSAKLFYYQGYVNTGLNEILKVCNIPKGSFYYYFKNKDDLLKHVIEYHIENLIKFFDANVDDLSMVKLRTFFYKYFKNIIDNGCHGGSLLGNLAIEMSDINEDIRLAINAAYSRLELRMMIFLQMVYNTNPKYSHINPEMLSKVLICQMEGTMNKLKLSKNKEEIDNFFKLFDYLVYKTEM